MNEITVTVGGVDIEPHELPVFGNNGWVSSTRFGMVWKLLEDEDQNDPMLTHEALLAVREVILTGRPPFGGWR